MAIERVVVKHPQQLAGFHQLPAAGFGVFFVARTLQLYAGHGLSGAMDGCLGQHRPGVRTLVVQPTYTNELCLKTDWVP